MYLLIIFGCAGSHCCTGFSLVLVSGSCSLVVVHGLPLAVDSLAAKHGLQSTRASVVAAHGPRSCDSRALEHQAQYLWGKGLVAPSQVGSSRIRDQTHVSCIGGRILYHRGSSQPVYLFM